MCLILKEKHFKLKYLKYSLGESNILSGLSDEILKMNVPWKVDLKAPFIKSKCNVWLGCEIIFQCNKAKKVNRSFYGERYSFHLQG